MRPDRYRGMTFHPADLVNHFCACGRTAYFARADANVARQCRLCLTPLEGPPRETIAPDPPPQPAFDAALWAAAWYDAGLISHDQLEAARAGPLHVGVDPAPKPDRSALGRLYDHSIRQIIVDDVCDPCAPGFVDDAPQPAPAPPPSPPSHAWPAPLYARVRAVARDNPAGAPGFTQET